MPTLIEQAEAKRVAANAIKARTDALLALDDLSEGQQKQVDAWQDDEIKLLQDADDLESQAKKADKLTSLRAAADKPRDRQTTTVLDKDVKVTDPKAEDPNRGFQSPREFLSAVMRAGNNRRGSQVDERLLPLAAVGGDEQSTFEDEYGGFLVPSGFSPELLSTPSDEDPAAGRTKAVPMTSGLVPINARVDKDHSSSVSGGLQVYRRAEADTVGSSRMKFEQIELRAHALMGVSFATEEILTDSPVSFMALLEDGFADEFRARLHEERLNGSGVGEFLGIMNSDCLISIPKEAAQAADTILYENLIKMRARVWGYRNAIWQANSDCIPQLMLMNQAVGTGGVPVWQPSAREDHPDILLGRPIFFGERLATVGDTGDIMCNNWTQYLEGTMQGVSSDESIHVRFVNLERAFRFYMRNGGAPWWKTVMTPKRGATMSPFVKLDART